MPVFRSCRLILFRKERPSWRFCLQELTPSVSSGSPEGTYHIVLSPPVMALRSPEIQRPPKVFIRFKHRIAFRPPDKIAAFPHVYRPSLLSRTFKTIIEKIFLFLFPGNNTYISGMQILNVNFIPHSLRLLLFCFLYCQNNIFFRQ